MKRISLITLLFAAMILAVTGCERTVTEKVDPGDFADASCFTCHGDNGYLLQAEGEWANSVHASGSSIDYTNRGGSDCTECHDHQGFIEYLATGEVSAPYDSVSAIHCFTCHAPHERGDMTIRTDKPYTLMTGVTFDGGYGNLCANCHHARETAEEIGDGYNISSSHWGPHHGPQADMIAGANAYVFAGAGPYASTGHMGAIENTCATCHMGNEQTHGGYTIGGHSFNMEDEEGNTLGALCGDCHDGANKYDFIGPDSIDYDMDGVVEGYQTEIQGLLDSLQVLLMAQGTVSASGSPVSGVVADGGVAGATWNFRSVIEDRSMGVHNFQYMYSMLKASIDYVSSLPTR